MAVAYSYVLLVGFLAWYIPSSIRGYAALRHIPGPPTSGWSKLWMLYANTSGHMHTYFRWVNDKYGKLARIAPRILITDDATLVRQMNAVRSPYTRGIFYNAIRLHPSRDNIVSTRDEKLHLQLRTQMSHGYAGKENPNLEQDVDGRILRLVALIREKYVSTNEEYKPMNLARLTTFFTLDVISTIAFGKSFGFLDKDDDPYGYLNQLHTMLPAIIFFGVFPEVQKLLRLPMMQKLAPSATDANGLGKIMGFAKDVVAERFGPNKITRNDMLNSFLKHGLSQEQLESETLAQITAGSDSTATVIRMAIWLISGNTPVYTRLMEELSTAKKEGRLSRPILTDAEAKELPFLQACIRETMRMYPPVTGILAKEVPKEGDTYHGMFIPPGTQIAWNILGILRTKEVFGDDVDVFRPQRWMAGEGWCTSEAKFVEMDDTVNLVFGYGRYGCLGKTVAAVELNKTVAEILLRFSFQVANPARPFIERCVGFFLHDEMIFRVEDVEV